MELKRGKGKERKRRKGRRRRKRVKGWELFLYLFMVLRAMGQRGIRKAMELGEVRKGRRTMALGHKLRMERNLKKDNLIKNPMKKMRIQMETKMKKVKKEL